MVAIDQTLPDAVLLEILLYVILEEGDATILSLSLVGSKFRSLLYCIQTPFERGHNPAGLTEWNKMENKSKPCQEFNKMYTLQTLRRGLHQLLTRSLQSSGSSTYPYQMVDQHLERTSTALKDSGDQDN